MNKVATAFEFVIKDIFQGDFSIGFYTLHGVDENMLEFKSFNIGLIFFEISIVNYYESNDE